MDLRASKKLMMMYKVLHPRNGIDRLYVSRKKEGEESPAFKIASTYRYDDLKSILKK